ncbi:MAG: hypothetical protein A2583_08365 [Bdellovibrionales bacterium RIFOXYD1_FULL_53_11]|nr:MAG: hypothetical protein A2583_08365 [Bdellovibrionales bacterium RIFOXYD1_FULL_53_11]
MKNFDFVVIGGGIVGMTVARELAARKAGRIALFEKEDEFGCHASGRNSGVLHSGIYYSAESIKARVCAAGSRRMQQYAVEKGIPLRKCGKVVVAPSAELLPQLDVLMGRAAANGIKLEKIDEKQLAELEPLAARGHGVALFSPTTAVIDTKAVLRSLAEDLAVAGVEVVRSVKAVGASGAQKILRTTKADYGFGHLVNCAGLHADRVAHWFGAGKKYRILPFKGVYKKLVPETAARLRGAIYPTPDLRVPFLGVHLTRTVDGEVIVGPTAIPAFGRENYGLLSGIDLAECPGITRDLLGMLVRDTGGFRTLVREEFGRYYFPNFLRAARALVPSLGRGDFRSCKKVGLRAQLFNIEKGALEMDFVIEAGPASTHVLNAVSPAFTASFEFAGWVAGKALGTAA